VRKDKDVAPSTELRRWYGHDPKRSAEFSRRYRSELRNEPALAIVTRLRDVAGRRRLILLTATRDVERSGAGYSIAPTTAATERSTSASVVRQLDTEMRMRRWPRQVVAPIQHSPERCIRSMIRSVRSSSPKPTRT
jgi:hypothetical protein